MAGRSNRTGHHRASSRTARWPRLRAAFRRLARTRRGPAAAPSSSDTVMEMLRIVDDGIREGSGGEMVAVAVMGLPFSGRWACESCLKLLRNGGPSYLAIKLFRIQILSVTFFYYKSIRSRCVPSARPGPAHQACLVRTTGAVGTTERKKGGSGGGGQGRCGRHEAAVGASPPCREAD
jgi:hypothetical protein